MIKNDRYKWCEMGRTNDVFQHHDVFLDGFLQSHSYVFEVLEIVDNSICSMTMHTSLFLRCYDVINY